MEIPFYILLIIYLIGILIFLVITFFNIYHLFKFGFFDFTGKLNAMVFVGFSVVIVAVSVLLLWNIPWFDSFDLFSLFESISGGSPIPTGSII
ncbi:MAG: hypothetical protein COW24_02235 [Candidatus Kerfeldbacteria bacterium CG15_BIG_FIL_POST_REV_8_21_14_020_45_12]|uniref:Uncharacterized protein n=1 Tax=Candidatus Kerfeldbacteria bacterium CG15_BIG_FIL_POST_REV_8_21_14_020_45_12 TaxID=2014247 RepID=A0A2M7H4A2_9BACT|nr:MAG: hypothetical protein COW24_02235 [Candidatus Kerfeldbacteria bacterium CG15_BIG_FIL_POST_REV_8_21_14_020_45_12]PJA93936.1 MAG: hypothetical protein CO132_00635 [Candidatus Kerfeldbacteria bacterium CG_4_9_14_3_um_filter_45_8]